MPTVLDMASADEAHDIFGRERFSQHRDDMGGVGSFNSVPWMVFTRHLSGDPSREWQRMVEINWVKMAIISFYIK